MADKTPVTLTVEGMTCNNCALGITRKLQKMGMQEVVSDFASGEVVYTPVKGVSESSIRNTIEASGFKVVDADASAKKGLTAVEKRFWFCLVLTLPLFFSMFTPASWGLHNPWVQLALCIPVYVVGGWHFAKSAWGSLKTGVANMDVLIFIGATAAFVYSIIGMINHLGQPEMHDYLFFETTATIITLVLLGNVLEHRSIQQTTTAIRALSALQDVEAKRIDEINGETVITPVAASAIMVGDVLLVSEGAGIPCDGTLLNDDAVVDESMISGESTPVVHQKGEQVIGGTINAGTPFQMKATAVGSKTVLSSIIKLVKQAQHDKPPVQRLSDKIAMIFVPVVIGIAALTFLVGWLYFDLALQDAMMNAIAVLVISCPCAMGLAIPTAVIAGVGRAARNGILIRGGSTLERFQDLKFMVFDKTGTLTTGKFEIASFEALPGFDEILLKRILKSLETQSGHPIAKSIVEGLADTPLLPLHEVKEIKGIGVSGKDEAGNEWQIGSKRLLKDHPESGDLFILRNNALAAKLFLRDALKPGIPKLIEWLKQKGIMPVLISGDRQEKCEDVASKVGIEQVHAEQLPDQKLEWIRHYASKGKIAMVGDGINDAPALALADVGISLSDATQVAMQEAQVILVNSHDMQQLQSAILIADHTMRTIKQNLFWAFFYNVVAIPVAAMGYLSPMIAALAMAFSDVIVIGNSIRLKYKKIK